MNDLKTTRKIMAAGVGVLLAPAFWGIPGALIYFIAYRYLGIEMQLEPKWLGAIDILLGCLAGISCIVIIKKIFKIRIWAIVVLALPIIMWALIRCSFFQDELVAFLGYSCCRDVAPTIKSVLTVAINPFIPFWQMLVH
jgi:hypothetical protein